MPRVLPLAAPTVPVPPVTAALAELAEPSSRFLLLNWVVPAMRLMLLMADAMESWSALSAVGSLAPTFAAWTTSERMLIRSEWTSLRAPSAVLTTLMASLVLRVAWVKPADWARRLSEMTRPAESSAAELMRRPDERRWMFF